MATNQVQSRATLFAPPHPSAFISRALCHPRALLILVFLGLALRVWAFAPDTSLYLDEVLLTRNILDLPLSHLLTKPLLLDQVAPRGFLFLERLAVILLGPAERALRLLPFLCAIASLLLFWRLALRALAGLGPFIALFLFAISVPFIRFGAEVKQYECDLLAAVLLTFLLLKLWQEPASRLRLVLAGFTALLLVWLSQASVLVMAGLASALALEWLLSRDPRAKSLLLFTIPAWAAASLIAVLAGLRSMTPSTRQFMNDFWSRAFLPLPFHWRSAFLWLGERFTGLFSDPTLLRYRWPLLFLLFAALGIPVMWTRLRFFALILCAIPGVALFAAIAHQYPWGGRLVFWILPFALLAVASGLDWIQCKAAAIQPLLAAILLLAVLSIPLAALAQALPPYDLEHHKQMLGYLALHRHPGDVIYVAQLQQVGAHFYAPRFGLQPAEWVTGICESNDSRAFLRDVDRFRGVRAFWLLSGSGTRFRPVQSALRDYLATIGTRRDSRIFPSLTLGSVSIELYDLSDSARLLSADADSFPIPPMPRNPKIDCRPWTSPQFDWRLPK